jgi:hypothetical protein
MIVLLCAWNVACDGPATSEAGTRAWPPRPTPAKPAKTTKTRTDPKEPAIIKSLREVNKDDLGLGDYEMGSTKKVTLTESDSDKRRNGYTKKLPMTLQGNRCYAVAAVAGRGTQLYLAAADENGWVRSEDSDLDEKGLVLRVGLCVASKSRVTLMIVANKTVTVEYRMFEKANHLQREMETDVRAARQSCRHGCKVQRDMCADNGSGTCADQYSQCMDVCPK